MANTLSDIQLRKKLTELGEDVGPITDSTRHLYQKRLDKLLAENKKSRRRSQPVSNLGHLSSDDSDSENISTPKSASPAANKLPALPSYRRSPRTSNLSNSARSSPSTRSSRAGSGSSPVLTRSALRSSSTGKSSPPPTLPDSSTRSKNTQLDHRISSDSNHQANSGFSQGRNGAVFGYPNQKESRTSGYQWVSMSLPIFAVFFFVILGILYMGVHQNNKQEDFIKSLNMNYTLCEVKSEPYCIPQRKLPQALDITRKLFDILSTIAGKYDCGDASSRMLRETEIHNLLEYHKFKADDLKEAVTLMHNNPEWGFRLYNDHREVIKSLDEKVVHFESSIAAKTFFCRFRQACAQVIFQLFLVFIAIALILVALYCVKLYKAKKEEERFKLYDMVEKILTILKENAEGSDEKEPCIPRVHVRDMLIPPSHRKKMNKLWLKAVEFIENNDSRVRTEKQQIQGESFVVWKWVSQGEPKAKVWQGKAFENSGSVSNTLPFVPSPCLKIRNMFDPDVEYCHDWPEKIQNAILEKCEGISGIVHIRVDTSSKEGCVYMKCSTLDAAGQSYKSLHGWWFDGNLVTVKYLHLERYHERFPEAQYCKESLKPSNSLRLSMSAPPKPNPLESL